MATHRFGSLDGLRAISIVAVIWHHAASESLPEWVPWVHSGNRGVNLFFAISAFLITTLLLRAKHRGTLQIPRFWVRRALRIFPLYNLVLLVYVASAAWHEHDRIARAGFFQHLPWFLTFTSNWFVTLDSPRVLFYFAWSLAAEEHGRCHRTAHRVPRAVFRSCPVIRIPSPSTRLPTETRPAEGRAALVRAVERRLELKRSRLGMS